MREKADTCCFTGHRDISGVTYKTLADRTERLMLGLIRRNYRYFVCGGAVGFDTFAALMVLSLRKRGADIKLVLMLPCRDQTAKWSDYDKAVYAQILSQADEVIYCSEEYFPGCMQKRNRAMVDASSACICYLTEPHGGTYQTAMYAREKGLAIVNVAND